jgi:hypothetical protein
LAFLDDLDGACRLLDRLLEQKAFDLSESAGYLYFVSMKDNACLRELLDDPANRAPFPVVDWDWKKMLAEL